MRNNKIKNIRIYSDSNFIDKTLSQFCKDFICEAFSYSCFTSTSINTKPSIAIIDIRNQMIFDKIIEPYLYLHSLYPLILLAPGDFITSYNSVDTMHKPLQYKALFEKINHLSNSPIHQVSHNIFLNSKTLNLIKISNHEKIETKLTDSEFKILSYLLEVGSSNEKEILSEALKYNPLASTNTFHVHLNRLKQKLGKEIIERKGNGDYAIPSLKIRSEGLKLIVPVPYRVQ